MIKGFGLVALSFNSVFWSRSIALNYRLGRSAKCMFWHYRKLLINR